MTELALLLAAAAVGVDYGWQRTENGDLEYIIQIEPELLQALAEGEPIISEVHPDVRGVRRFRIKVGTGRLPQEAVAPRPETAAAAALPSRTEARPPIGTDPRGAEPMLPGPVEEPLPGPAVGAQQQAAPPAATPPEAPFQPRPQTPPDAATRNGDNPRWTLPGDSRPAMNAPRGAEDGAAEGGGIGFGGARNHAADEDVRFGGDERNQFEATGPEIGAGAGLGGAGLGGAEPGGDDKQQLPLAVPPPEDGRRGIKPIADPDANRSGFSPQAAREREPIRPIEPPRSFPEPHDDPLVKPAGGLSAPASVNSPSNQSAAAPKPGSETSHTAEKSQAAEAEPPRPWLTLGITALLLFASLAANAWLGWIAHGFYRRYRDLADEIRNAPSVEPA